MTIEFYSDRDSVFRLWESGDVSNLFGCTDKGGVHCISLENNTDVDRRYTVRIFKADGDGEMRVENGEFIEKPKAEGHFLAFQVEVKRHKTAHIRQSRNNAANSKK